MKNKSLLRPSLIGSLLLISAVTTLHSKEAWPPKMEGIKGDSAVLYGTLENGVRWAYLPNAHPEDQLSLRLIVETGSFMEEDNELGIAHFLEHMAFNGSVHFPEAGQVIETFQRHGLTFGRQVNAQTGFLSTLYSLDLPNLEEEVVSDAFLFLQDQASGQIFDKNEIEKERGVILEEMRTRNSSHYRAYFSNLGFLLGEGRFAKRSPMGTEALVKSFSKPDFERFYRKWYTADRMIVVGVGSLPVEVFKKKVSSSFGDVVQIEEPLPNPSDPIEAPKTVSVHFTDTPDAEHCMVQFASLKPLPQHSLTYDDFKQKTLEELTASFLAIHFNMQVAGGEVPYLQSVPNIQKEDGLFKLTTLAMVTQPSQLDECLEKTTKDLKRISEKGFEKDAEKRMKDFVLSFIEKQVGAAPTRQNTQLIQEMVSVFSNKGTVFMHPSESYEIVKKWMKHWSGDDIAETIRHYIHLDEMALLIQGKQSEIASDKDSILAEYQTALNAKSEKEEKSENLEWAYSDFGEPGKVIQKEFDEDLEITRIQFQNGVRVNLKELRTRRNQLGINVRIGQGRMGIKTQNRAFSLALPLHLQLGALGKHSLSEFQKISMGKQVALMPANLGDLALEWNGGGTKKDFPFLLEMITVFISDPGFRISGDTLFKQVINSTWKDKATNPAEVFEFDVKPFLYSQDWRFTHPSKAEQLSQSFQDSVQWLKPELESGYMEVGIAGDFDADKMIAELARTIGTLPERSTEAPKGTSADGPRITNTKQQEFKYSGPDPKASLVVCIPACDGIAWEKATQCEVLTEVLNNELTHKIREEMGGSYHISCQSKNDWDFPGFGRIIIQMECDPTRMDQFEAGVKEVMTALVANGCSKDMLKRALKPKISQFKDSLKDPNYWLGFLLSRSQGTPWVNDRMKRKLEVLELITTEDMDELAREYFDPNEAIFARVVPSS